MTRLMSILLALSLLANTTLALPAADQVPLVRLNTDEGPILLALWNDLAPNHAANFIHLAETGYYNETYFHRIIPGFMIQGGDGNSKDFDPRNDGKGNPGLQNLITDDEKAQLERIQASLESRGYVADLLASQVFLKAEFSPTAKHLRGTLSMARRSNPVDSAGSQFFICHERGRSTAGLDRKYTVFGQVVMGQAVVDTIVTAERAKRSERPVNPVHINSTEVVYGIQNLSAEEQVAYHEMLKYLAENDSVW